MPTTRRRHIITETDEASQALQDAARRWPEERNRRARLLARLVRERHRAVIEDREKEVAHRREALRRTAGVLSGAYEEDYLAQCRKDWPS